MLTVVEGARSEGLALDRNWGRVVDLLERALELARAREHPSTVRALAEEVLEECVYLARPTPNDRLLERGITSIAELLRLDQAAVLEMKRIGPMGWRRINSELARHHLGEPLAEHPALGSGR